MKNINQIQINRILQNFPSFIPEWTRLAPTSEVPTREPSRTPTKNPTSEPTKTPTHEPTKEPTREPTTEPTREPTKEPTREPTKEPTSYPTRTPTLTPTNSPSYSPSISQIPTTKPSQAPSSQPSEFPSSSPSHKPSSFPTVSLEPSLSPSISLHAFPVNTFYLSLSCSSSPINAESVLKIVDSHLASFVEENTHSILNFNGLSLSIFSIKASSSNKYLLRFGFSGETYFRTLDKIDDDFINGLVTQAFNGVPMPLFLYSLQDAGLDVENVYYLFDVKEDVALETTKTKSQKVKVFAFVLSMFTTLSLAFYCWKRHISPGSDSFIKSFRSPFVASDNKPSETSKYDRFKKLEIRNESKEKQHFVTNWNDTSSNVVDNSPNEAEKKQSLPLKKRLNDKKKHCITACRNSKHQCKKMSQFRVNKKFLDKIETLKNEKNFWRKHKNTDESKPSNASSSGEILNEKLKDQPKNISRFLGKEIYLDRIQMMNLEKSFGRKEKNVDEAKSVLDSSSFNGEGLDISVVSSAQYDYTINGSIVENNSSTASDSSSNEDSSEFSVTLNDHYNYTINESISENKSNRKTTSAMSICSSVSDNYSISDLYQDSPLSSKKE